MRIFAVGTKIFGGGPGQHLGGLCSPGPNVEPPLQITPEDIPPRDYPTENLPEVTPRGSVRVRMPPRKSDRVMQEYWILLVFKFSLSLHSARGGYIRGIFSSD